MLKVLSNLALTTVADNGSTLSIIALVAAVLALLIAFAALSRARKAGQAAQAVFDEAVTATKPVGSQASPVSAAGAVSAGTDDRQLVAVMTAAVAAILADEQGAAAAGTITPRISSIRRVGSAAPSVSAAKPPVTGPYAGFVVRRIRRV